MDEIYSIIKSMIMNPSKKVMRVPFHVKSYENVLDIWNVFKKNEKINVDTTDNRLLDGIFQFHLSDVDHIILYYSKHLEDCLLMCKVREKYVNMVASIKPLDQLGYSLIATYC